MQKSWLTLSSPEFSRRILFVKPAGDRLTQHMRGIQTPHPPHGWSCSPQSRGLQALEYLYGFLWICLNSSMSFLCWTLMSGSSRMRDHSLK